MPLFLKVGLSGGMLLGLAIILICLIPMREDTRDRLIGWWGYVGGAYIAAIVLSGIYAIWFMS